MPVHAPRDQVVAKKKGSGIGSLLGGLMGAGDMSGGYTPGTPATAQDVIPAEYNPAKDTTSETAESGGESAMPEQEQIAAKPGGFQRYSVQHPILDMIFNKGAGAQQANQFNFSQGLTQAQIDAQATANAQRNMTELQKQQLANQGQLDVTKEGGFQARETDRSMANTHTLGGKGIIVTNKSVNDYGNAVNPSLIQGAGLDANSSLQASMAKNNFANDISPRGNFSKHIAQATQDQIDMPAIEARGKSAIGIQPNEMKLIPSLGGQPNQLLEGNKEGSQVVMTGGFPLMDKNGKPTIGPDGKPQMIGQKPEILRNYTSGSLQDLDAIEAKKQAAQQSLMQGGNNGYTALIGPANVNPMPGNAQNTNGIMAPQVRAKPTMIQDDAAYDDPLMGTLKGVGSGSTNFLKALFQYLKQTNSDE